MSATMLDVAIIGAGPAALAAAISIAKHCPASVTRVTVFEARSSLKEHAGVQYTLGHIGLNALDVLGIRNKIVEKAGNVNSGLWFIDQAFNESKRMELSFERGKEMFVHFERVKFIEALAEELQALNVEIQFSKRFVSHDPVNHLVKFDDGTSAAADLLVGADGIFSSVRAAAIEPIVQLLAQGNKGYYVSVDLSDIASKPVDMRTDNEEKALAFANGRESVFSFGVPSTMGLFSLGQNRLCFFDVVTEHFEKTVFEGDTHETVDPMKRQIVLKRLAQAHRPDLRPHPCPHLALLPFIIDRLEFPVGAKENWTIRYMPLLESTVNAENAVVIIGDAAHAIPPAGGYGAQSSLEDGAFLGLALRDRYFSDAKLSLADMLLEFSETRKLVTHPIQRYARYANSAFVRRDPRQRIPINFRPPVSGIEMLGTVAEIVWANIRGVEGITEIGKIPGTPGAKVVSGMRLYIPGQM
ncbi:hypothetical protein BJ742DRAFT_295 [Cladochytrium replicatum]|nr:hypothetical protein BJ742DRAFT_295 [Cladochytrium replicatum]